MPGLGVKGNVTMSQTYNNSILFYLHENRISGRVGIYASNDVRVARHWGAGFQLK